MFRGFFKRIFKFLLQIQQENSFYLSVNTGKPNFLAFLVFVGKCTSVSFADEMSFSETVAKWDVKTVNSEGYFEINRPKKAILQFGKYR